MERFTSTTANDELKPIATFAGNFRQLQGITVDDRGDLYVAVQTDLKHRVGHIIKLSKGNTGFSPTFISLPVQAVSRSPLLMPPAQRP